MTDVSNVTVQELRERYSVELTRLAAFLLDRPGLLDAAEVEYGGARLYVVVEPDQLAGALRMLGTAEKYADDSFIGARRRFGPHVLDVCSYRDSTCAKVPTGETVTRTVVVNSEDDVPEGATVVRREAEKVERITYTVTEDVTRWECPPSLLA